MKSPYTAEQIQVSREQFLDMSRRDQLVAERGAMNAWQRICDMGHTGVAIARLETMIRERTKMYPDIPEYTSVIDAIVSQLVSEQ